MVPDYAADGVGKMAYGGKAKVKKMNYGGKASQEDVTGWRYVPWYGSCYSSVAVSKMG